jgi:hypothetical protein
MVWQVDILTAGEAGSLKLAEFNPLDADDLGAAIKRGGRVVLVVGDQVGLWAVGLRRTADMAAKGGTWLARG